MSTIMTELGVLKLLDQTATPAPWTASPDNSDPEQGDVVIWGPVEDWLANVGNWARQNPEASAEAQARQFVETRDAADARLIVSTRNALPALLAEIELLRNALEATLVRVKPWFTVEELMRPLGFPLRPERKLGER